MEKKAQEAAEKRKTGPGHARTAPDKQATNAARQQADDPGQDTTPILPQDRIAGAGESLYEQDHGLQTNTGTYDHLDFQRLYLRDGAGEKFWEAALSGNKLVIRWGKTEGKGQIQLKTLPSEAAAKSEMEKLIQQKKGKGYQDPR
jgi:predicted DNA-binding WGR domain protein